MNLEKMIQNYKTETKVIPREEKILETIQKSKEVMMEVQSEHTMSYGEFLFSQFRLIRKRWWMLQAALLIVTFFLMNYLDDSEYLMRTLGTSSVLFIVAGKRVKDLLAQVGLTKSANKKMKKLSGGMKRRAGIAQAMLNNPKILILDEPTAGLDPTERVRFRNLISELSEDRIVILSTHIVSDVEYIANEIWLMKDGQIMQQGNLDQTLASMQEKVYACEVSQADATKMMKKFKVSNMKSERGMVELRIIAGEPPIAGASVVEPTLEDVFLYYFGEKGGEME